jgi:MFS family permease
MGGAIQTVSLSACRSVSRCLEHALSHRPSCRRPQAAQNGEMMLAGRFFAGFSIGQLSFLAPLYQSEIAHPSIRGRLTTLQQFALGWGGPSTPIRAAPDSRLFR